MQIVSSLVLMNGGTARYRAVALNTGHRNRCGGSVTLEVVPKWCDDHHGTMAERSIVVCVVNWNDTVCRQTSDTGR